MFTKHGGLNLGRVSLIILVILVAIALFFMSINRVDAGYVGVITRWGAVNRVVYPGISWKIPIAEGIRKMDVRTLKDQVDVAAASKDLQTVTSTVAVNYHLDGQYAAAVYQSVGMHYQDVLIAPAVQNIFKATTAKYTAEELITKREQVRLDSEKALETQLLAYHVIVENFNIVNFDFSPEFNAAIEAKQVAQQQVETAKQLLAKAQIEAQTAVAQAQGQADAQAALKNTGALTPEYLEYLALTKWNGVLPIVTSGTPFIDVTGFTK
ncbi:MAG: prohibitin family protein [Anaerolineales bacterium]|jgi:regulator of protease activity HflC (stomatin/prohibitin superfamily)